MSQIRNAIFGALAISATLGAVQLAWGYDLIGRAQPVSTAPETGINRAGKADRAAVKAAPGQTRTVTLLLNSLADTSVVLRVPAVKDEARNRPVPSARPESLKPGSLKPGSSKTTVACEPPVSVLTDVAKLLQPGRCIT